MEYQYDLIIVGSGPGGYVAAARAAQLGMKTAVIEKNDRLGGVCLNVGCIPSKALLDSSEYYHLAKTDFDKHGVDVSGVALNLEKMMERKAGVVNDLTDQVGQLLEGNKVDVIRGTAKLSGENGVDATDAEGNTETYTAKNIMLATGSTPFEVPGMPFDGEKIISSTEALSLKEVPDHLVLVGGGYIGLELGSVWLRLGAKVTVVEMMPNIAGQLDGQVIRSLTRILKKQGFDIRTNTKVEKAGINGDKVLVSLSSGGKEDSLECDKLLVAVGRKPLTQDLGLEELGIKTHEKTGHILVDEAYRTNVPSILAIGDLTPGPMLAHKASAEGIAAVECLAGLPGDVNYDAIPGIMYTHPEAAMVGITEETAREREIPYCTGSYPFSGAGRARCMGETDGFVKIITHSKTDRILGVHIIGPRASDIIAECVLAMEFGASSEDIARTVHGHPTFSEALMEAALTARKCSIYTS